MKIIADDRFALPDDPERLTDDQRIRTGGPYYISMLKSDNVCDNKQQLKCQRDKTVRECVYH